MLPSRSLVSAEKPGQDNKNSAGAEAPTAGSLPAAATSACDVGPPLSGGVGGILSRSRYGSKRSSFFRIHARKATTVPASAPASVVATPQTPTTLIATTASDTAVQTRHSSVVAAAAFLTTSASANLPAEYPDTNRASPPLPAYRARRPLTTSCAPPAKEAKQSPDVPALEATKKSKGATATRVPIANPLAAGAGTTNLAGASAHQIAVASPPSLAATAKTPFPSLSEATVAAVCSRDPHPPLLSPLLLSCSPSLPKQSSASGDADDSPGAVAGGHLRTGGRHADRDYLQRIPLPTRQRPGQHAPPRMNMEQSNKSGANRGVSALPSPPPTRATHVVPSAATTPAPHRGLPNSTDFLSSPNSIISATPPSAFSPALASPSPASTSPEADAPFDPVPSAKKSVDAVAGTPLALADPAAGRQGPSRPPATGSACDLGTALNPIPESAPISLEDCQRSIPARAQDASSSPLGPGSDASITEDCNLSPSQRPQLVRPKASRPHRLGQLTDAPSSPFTASPTAITPIREPLKFSSLSRASSTRSVCSNAPLQHPTPELNARSGAYTGNIAALEASAERLSMTSSIEDAIRDAHAQLKRSDSQRSAALANSLRNADGPSLPHVVTRQLSIVSLNSAARSGGYSPGGYVMSPNHSLSNSRVRSGSTTSRGAAPVVGSAVIPEDGGPVEDLVPAMPPIMPRHGPGKSSVRSVRSSKLSLAEIAEVEPPVTLTQEALDQADHLPDLDDEDETVRPGALRIANMGSDQTTPNANHWEETTPTGPREASDYGFDGHPEASSSRQRQQPSNNRPQSTDTTNTDDTQNAFGDFDGVHCDPDHVDFGALPSLDFGPQYGQPDHHYGQQQHPHDYLGQPHGHGQHYDQHHEPPAAVPRPQPHQRHVSERPKSYFDMNTGHEMLYYPAPVPAMLNLPPKLSKKPKAAQRNARHSRVLETMAQQTRDSRIWLPDTLETGDFSGSFMGGEDHSGSPEKSPLAEAPTSMLPLPDLDMPQEAGPHSRAPAPHYPSELRRPAKLTDAEKRKSKMSLMPVDLPPQLRASAFFDLPSTNATPIELKNGSAMSTLDSILDASASAPVSAFTDHTFAGKLGSEVYGAEKKKKKKKIKKTQNNNTSANITAPSSDKDGSMSTVREDSKPRASFLGLVGVGKRHSNESGDHSALPESRGQDSDRSTSSRKDGLAAPDGGLLSPNSMMAPHDDEKVSSDEEDEDEDEDEEDEDEELYEGPPTTLLAELQIRKQRAKARTRLPAQAHSHGMHTTLLELDAVAEVERKNRKGKRVNLAWEDPALAQDDEDEDEDVPLAFLQAVRANPNADISVVVAEAHRPLGLMERREQEDNEPLSRRRDRLQGHAPEPPQGVYLTQVQQTRAQSQMGFVPSASALNLSSNNLLNPQNRGITSASRLGLHQPPPLSPQHQADGSQPAEEENEDEPLGERMRRLKARDDKDTLLPLARPISGAFSVEVLSQFGDLTHEEETEAGKNKGKSILAKGKEPPKTASSADGSSKSAATPAKGAEVEETLGQRRRRLQAEREAREREMGILGGGNGNGLDLTLGAGLGLSGNNTMQHARAPSKPMGMADILGAHPLERPMGKMDPREAERRRIEAEAERARLETEEKMRRMRAELALVGGTAPGSAGQPQPTMRAVGGNMGMNLGMGMSMGIGSNRQVSGSTVTPKNGYGNAQGLLHQQRPGLQYHMATGSVSHTQMMQQRQLQQQFQQPGLNGGLVGSAGNFGPDAQQAQPGLMYGGAPPVGGYGAYGGAGPMPMQMQLGMQMPMMSGQQTDHVERWRQGVMH
ncbi:hypothetical protein MAPG_06126 [Magnaporthiopsis poae ATCC 64411]|uniref:Uncharacterized protein n=1 Tax=Magnaporthiopsis poae (strain ATCC 64411 / 73-15) TaxID=644358 RepID=A0A0C4E175_MAGP6|nr:hypothetical protein MAPG_06126 [Magnaporthiopsis poae ATCC 64411]